MVRVQLPYHLQTLAGTTSEIRLPLADPVTQQRLLQALEERFPALRGAIVDPATGRRRPLLRFFACQRDLSHLPPDQPLPEAVAAGREPFLIIGAIAGG